MADGSDDRHVRITHENRGGLFGQNQMNFMSRLCEAPDHGRTKQRVAKMIQSNDDDSHGLHTARQDRSRGRHPPSRGSTWDSGPIGMLGKQKSAIRAHFTADVSMPRKQLRAPLECPMTLSFMISLNDQIRIRPFKQVVGSGQSLQFSPFDVHLDQIDGNRTLLRVPLVQGQCPDPFCERQPRQEIPGCLQRAHGAIASESELPFCIPCRKSLYRHPVGEGIPQHISPQQNALPMGRFKRIDLDAREARARGQGEHARSRAHIKNDAVLVESL